MQTHGEARLRGVDLLAGLVLDFPDGLTLGFAEVPFAALRASRNASALIAQSSAKRAQGRMASGESIASSGAL